jgi:hypothetical protein
MDADKTNPDDLSKLEKRLAEWSPAREGLDPDSMLFAAGRASALSGKSWIPWPIVSAALAVMALALGFWASRERSERIALLQAFESRAIDSGLTVIKENGQAQGNGPQDSYGYLVLRHEWEKQPGDWQVKSSSLTRMPNSSVVPEPTILRAWQPQGPNEPL